jgi:uncharacterized protein with HEPN domain
MRREARKRLLDALDACRLIEQFTSGQTFAEYDTNSMLSAAVERKFEIIGEALRLAEAADESVVEKIPDLRKIVGMRNRIIHGYDAVDSETIWNVVEVHLPALMMQIERILATPNEFEAGGLSEM